HATDAQAFLSAQHDFALDEDAARSAYAAFTNPREGFGADARLDEVGLRQVIALRSALGGSPTPLGQPDDYIDLRWFQHAIQAGG
ncbi:MAG TPA: hypothetical protein VKQ36_10910, partial [Ktedonobacterales bacterium]|nr:hypothetical protein [Ktedonobacterales bacterium]